MKKGYDIEFNRDNIAMLRILTSGRLGRVSIPRNPNGVMLGTLYTSSDYSSEDIGTHKEKQDLVEGDYISYDGECYTVIEQ